MLVFGRNQQNSVKQLFFNLKINKLKQNKNSTFKKLRSGPITSRKIDGEKLERVTDFIFGAPKSLQMVAMALKLKDSCSLEEKL